MRRRLQAELVLSIAIAGAACARQDVPAASPARPLPATPRVIAEVPADVPHLVVRVLELKRTGPDVVTAALLLVNTGSPGQDITLGSTFASDPRDAGTLADMSLMDEEGQRKYYVLRNAADRPRCSNETAALVPGEPRAVWATFPAPPAGVSRMTIFLPHVTPIRGVPVS